MMRNPEKEGRLGFIVRAKTIVFNLESSPDTTETTAAGVCSYFPEMLGEPAGDRSESEAY